LIGQKAPLKLKDIWAIRIRLQLGRKIRDLAPFNLAIGFKLPDCDLVGLRVSDVAHGGQIASRAMVMRQKTGRPVQFKITQSTGEAVQAWITHADIEASDFLFNSRVSDSLDLSTRQYVRIVHRWVEEAGLASDLYGKHIMRGIKASLIYRRTRNLRLVQLLLGHTKFESTERYLDIEVHDALEIAEHTDV
jgi:site-specific recombinase XerC